MKYVMYLVFLLGAFEVVSNTYHLSKGSIAEAGRSAKRQHQELPPDIRDVHFFVKAIIMLGFGLLFLVSSILFVANADPRHAVGSIAFVLFACYGVAQAVVYRKAFNVWPASLVYAVPLVLSLIVG